MTRTKLFLATAILLLMVATNSSAAVARVFLAGTGNDANDCTVQSTPCQSLQGAVNACPINGEIIVLDNGGYGAATITKSLTINASAGIVAFVARTITVNIGASDKVVLRGLSMNGVVFGDANGIYFSGGGTLLVENSIFAGFSNGIRQLAGGSTLLVNNCEFRNNGYGLLNATGSLTDANTVIENSRFQSNAQGLNIAGAATVTIRNSVITDNGYGINANNGSSLGMVTQVMVDTCTVANQTTVGLSATSTNSASVVIYATNSTIYANAAGIAYSAGGGLVRTFGNNRVLMNGSGEMFGGGTIAVK